MNPGIQQAAEVAIRSLQGIGSARPPVENRRLAVNAAVAIDEVLKLLREGESGRDVILSLLIERSPESVSSDELRFSSGIQEFARRIRELREEGYDIEPTGDGYRLTGEPHDSEFPSREHEL